jgi:hypothetical protein
MKYKLLIVLLVNSGISYCQEYVVEKVKLTETVDNKYVSEIPKIKAKANDSDLVADIINSQILDRFMIKSYVQSELEEFRWYEVGFSSEIKDSILYISFAGEYYGAYPNEVSDEMFFNLKSGETLNITEIPFQALFTLPGYLDFLSKYWIEGVKAEFLTAVECAEFEPYCNYYDINRYTVNDNKLSVYLTDDCYPHVAQGCSPVYNISVYLDSIRQSLNNTGKYILIESNYLNMTPIEKFLENERLKEKVSDNLFLFGKIGDRFPFSMAINIDKPDDISGLYYYDNKLQKINLKGQIMNDSIFLAETVNNKQTGFFEFDIDIDNYPIDGHWLNFEKTKSLDVEFINIITCKKN